MVNWNSMFDWNFYPGIDLSYGLNENLRLMASVNLVGTSASFTELYYVGAGNQGNSALLPEKACTYEIGTRFQEDALMIQSAVFYRHR